MTKPITEHEYASLFPLMDKEQFEELKKDIQENGLQQPIYLYENQILDGRNRHKACLELGITPKFVEYKGTTPLSFIISLNLKRRHLTAIQRACVAVEALPLFQKEARKRQQLGGIEKVPQKFGEASEHEGEAEQQAAKAFNTNRQYINQANTTKQNNPSLFNELKTGAKQYKDLAKELRKEKIEKQKKEISELTVPTGKYNLIVVDPPWYMEGSDEESYDLEGNRGAPPYPTLSVEQIKNLKLPAEDDCVLWLWTIDSRLRDALSIIEVWGFQRKSTLIWVKNVSGLGRWLRNQHEYCFLCVKGEPKFIRQSVSSVLHAPRRAHSEKPDAFYDLVLTCGDYPKKLDYFARKKREGWDSFGDEVK